MADESTATDINGAAEPAAVADPAARIADLERQLGEQRDQALRARAELENLRRRAERDVENAHRYGLERIAGELLAVKDSLELGVAATVPGADVAKLAEGQQLTLRMFGGVLDKFGIREVSPLHQKFNPELHQAMTTQPAEGVEPNTVVAVFQKGYTLNERLLRPALVVVAAPPPETRIDTTA